MIELPSKRKGKNLIYLSPVAKEERKIKILENKIKRSDKKHKSLKKEENLLNGKQKERKNIIQLKKTKIEAIKKANEEDKIIKSNEEENLKKTEQLKEIDTMYFYISNY